MTRRFSTVLMATIVVLAFAALPALAGAGLVKPVSKVAEAQKLIDKAWALDRSDSNAEIFKQCIALIEQANKIDPNNSSILVEMSRYYWSYGDNLPKQTPEQKKFNEALYAKGVAAAEQSIKLKESAAAHYWLAVNKASSMEFSNIMQQAAAFPTIYKHSQYVTKNDPNYFYGAVGRLWSEILVRVPKKVVEMVRWNVQEAVDDIDKAIKIEPRYLDNYVYKARFFNAYFGKKDEALKLLEYVLKQDAATLFPEEVTANKVAQRNAKSLWKTITGKDYPAK